MSKAEEYIENYTNRCSNEVGSALYREIHHLEPEYTPWLTPDHARRVAQIAKEEVIEKAVKWLNKNTGFFNEKDFRKYMEEKV